MRKIFEQLISIRFGPVTFPLFLLALCIAAYAPLITRLGFYWDDFPISWIAATMGGEGLARYFSTNRPVWGLVYQVTTPLLGSQPLTWQIFALLMRWATGLLLWTLLRLVWQNRGEGKEFLAAWAAALFCLYPGFSQQFIAFLYSHFYIVLSAFLGSLVLMVLALRHKRWYWPLTAASMMLSTLNLLSMEYFFLLDLLRPLLIWVVLSDSDRPGYLSDRRKRLVSSLLAWLPFLAVFAGAMVWRSMLFGFYTYQPTLLSRLKTQPIQALAQLIPLVLQDVWNTSAGALIRAFHVPPEAEVGTVNLKRFWLLAVTGSSMAVLYLLLFGGRKTSASPALDTNQPAKSRAAWWKEGRWAWQPLMVGIVALFIAGSPFWLTDLEIGLVFANDRFTLPFMLGMGLATAALLLLLPLPRPLKAGVMGIILGFAIGQQFYYATAYARDWSVQRSMFWQLTWRAPDLKPGTLLVTNELPLVHYTDNSLAAPLNWIYDPNNQPEQMHYMMFYPTLRVGETWLEMVRKGQPIERDYLATRFYGNSSQVIVLSYNPPGCLRVLDPEIDPLNWMLPEYLREKLPLVNIDSILTTPADGKPVPRPPLHIYGDEIPKGWCYYFEKADLARQAGDWQEVATLGDQAFAEADYPNDPLERFPFIEGYAHTGNWDRAASLTRDSLAISPLVMQPMLCKLWERIENSTASSTEREAILKDVRDTLSCERPAGSLVQ